MKTHLSDGSSEDRSVARSLYLGREKLSQLRFQRQKLRNACSFSKGVRPCTYVNFCLSLHNTGGTTTPGGRDFRGSRKATLPSIKMFTKLCGGQYGPKWPIRGRPGGPSRHRRVNFSKLLVQRYLDSRGRGGVEFRLRQSNLHNHKDVYDFRVGKWAPLLTLSPEFATFWA